MVLVIFLLVGLFGAITAMIWLGHRFLKLREESDRQDPAEKKLPTLRRPGSDILKALRSEQTRGHYCADHGDMVAVGQCAISGESYCEHCLTVQKELKLAKKHLDLYLDSEWVEVVMLHNEDISQDAAERIVKVKRALWESEGLPMIVQGHYKINVQSDEIEGYTVVIARKDDREFIRKELSFIQ